MKKIVIGTRMSELYECILDDEDYELCSKYVWSIKKYPKSTYAVANYWHEDGKKTSITMHRLIMFGDEVMNHRNVYIDHLNGNGLDNRRSNLKKVTPLENSQNRQHIGINNTSGIIGVHYRETQWGKNTEPSGCWNASVSLNGKMKHKSFACKKHGYEQAKQMAIEQRKAWEKEFYHKWTDDEYK